MSETKQAYKSETNAAIIDAKMLLDKILWHDDSCYGALSAVDIERSDINDAWLSLDGIIYDKKISYDSQTSAARDRDVEHWTEIDDALKVARDRLKSIDDNAFWSEQKEEMEVVMDVLDNKCGINY